MLDFAVHPVGHTTDVSRTAFDMGTRLEVTRQMLSLMGEGPYQTVAD